LAQAVIGSAAQFAPDRSRDPSRHREASAKPMKLVLLSALTIGTAAKELTSSNWDAETSGKSVFVKFLAPW